MWTRKRVVCNTRWWKKLNVKGVYLEKSCFFRPGFCNYALIYKHIWWRSSESLCWTAAAASLPKEARVRCWWAVTGSNIWSPGNYALFAGGGGTQTNWVTLYWVMSWLEGKVNRSERVKGREGRKDGMHKHTAADWGCRAVGPLAWVTIQSLQNKVTRFYPLHLILGDGLRFVGTRWVRLLLRRWEWSAGVLDSGSRLVGHYLADSLM